VANFLAFNQALGGMDAVIQQPDKNTMYMFEANAARLCALQVTVNCKRFVPELVVLAAGI
jgi:hypothetical protein